MKAFRTTLAACAGTGANPGNTQIYGEIKGGAETVRTGH